MSDLIVNFPQDRQGYSNHRRRSSVEFAPTYEVRFYAADEDIAKTELHWQKNDYDEFKRANRRDIREIYSRYLSRSECTSKSEVLEGCLLTGVEKEFSPILVRRSLERKAGRLNAVLSEQERQLESGCFDLEKIAQASRRFSKGSVKQSQKIGALQEML